MPSQVPTLHELFIRYNFPGHEVQFGFSRALYRSILSKQHLLPEISLDELTQICESLNLIVSDPYDFDKYISFEPRLHISDKLKFDYEVSVALLAKLSRRTKDARLTESIIKKQKRALDYRLSMDAHTTYIFENISEIESILLSANSSLNTSKIVYQTLLVRCSNDTKVAISSVLLVGTQLDFSSSIGKKLKFLGRWRGNTFIALNVIK